MTYQEAIEHIFNTYQKEGFKNPFFTMSILSDLVGNSFQDYKLVKTLFKISQIVNVYELFEKNGLFEGRRLLKEEYKSLKSEISNLDFVDAVNPISKCLFPDTFTSSRDKAKEAEKTVVYKAKVEKQSPASQKLVEPSGLNFKPQKAPKPQKKKRPKRVDITWLNIHLKDATMTIISSPTDKIKIIDLSNNTELPNTTYIRYKEQFYLNLLKGGTYIMKVPQRMYYRVSVALENSSLFMRDSVKNGLFQTSSLEILGKNSFISLDVFTEYFKCESPQSSIYVRGYCKDVFIKSAKSSIYYLCDMLKLRPSCSHRISTKEGSIIYALGKHFSDFPKRRLFKPATIYSGSVDRYGTHIDLFLEAENGSISAT